MDEFEQTIRQVMLRHDRDVSGTVSLPRPTARRNGWLVPSLAAAAVVLLVGATIVALHSQQNSRGQAAGIKLAPAASKSVVPPLQSCPVSIPNPSLSKQPYIPAGATVADAIKRLIPPQQPAAALLCGYPTPVKTAPERIGLDASRRLTAGLPALADQLSWLPPASPTAANACAEDPTLHPPHSYLLQLLYPGGSTWVSLPASRCGTSITNGGFEAVASADALSAAAAAYRTGSWPVGPQQPNVCSGSVMPGRLGQESAMAPSSVTSISICYANRTYQVNASSSYAPILDELDALNTKPSTGTCTGSPTGSYAVQLSYRAGPPVQISITPGCQPSVDNGSLQATASARLLGLLAAATSSK
jgi:hypothetical protein